MSSINPFEIKTPESMSASDMVDLFVDVFSDFKQVLERGHTFLNGPRGSGKSMMFRYMMSDCQKIAKRKKKGTEELDFFAIYVPIKMTNINITELERFAINDYSAIVFNEHLFSIYILLRIFSSVKKSLEDIYNDHISEQIFSFYNDKFIPILIESGYVIREDDRILKSDGNQILSKIENILESININSLTFFKRYALSKENNSYKGCLLDFIGVILPLINEMKNFSLLPNDKPVFILIDDAGYLNKMQTQVLNTWVSYRTTKDVCFKISTQFDYKTYNTISNKRIDSPHDYSEINISTVYASSKSLYNKRVEEIVKRRIEKYTGQNVDVSNYFPEDLNQLKAKQQIFEGLKQKYYNPEKPWAGTDAANRYTTSEYIKNLKSHRSGGTYSYSGFDLLVSISSGIIRHFLAPAQEMYSEAFIKNNNVSPNFISATIQNNIIRKYSENFLTLEFEKIQTDMCESPVPDKMYKFITSLGELFHAIFMSEASERRVFSIALTDTPDKELKEILDMCEQFGYIHKSTIGNKTGLGRNRLYILTRILSPFFKLDPSSFAGYKFMNSHTLSLAIHDSTKFIKTVLKGNNTNNNPNQLNLEFEKDEN